MVNILVVGDFQGKFSNKLLNKIKKEEFDFVISVGDYAGIEDWQPWLKDSFRRSIKGEEWLSPEEFYGKKGFKVLIKKDDKAAKDVLKKLNSLGKKVILIFGNRDDEWYHYPFAKRNQLTTKKWKLNFVRRLKNLNNITYSKTKIDNISFIGFGGYMDVMANHENKPKTKENVQRKASATKRLKLSEQKFNKIIKGVKENQIFVLHYPPRGVFDIIKDKSNPFTGKTTGIEFFSREIKRHKPNFVVCDHMHEYRGMKKLYGVPIINPGDAEKDKYAVIEINEDGKLIKTRFAR